MQEEIWRPVVGYEGLYVVSNLGRVKSLHYQKKNREHILKGKISKMGYREITLSKNGKTRCFLAHRIVAQAFIPNPQSLPQINHKNEIKIDNRAENLEWCTCRYNIRYGTAQERKKLTQLNRQDLSRPVGQYAKSGELIKTYPSIAEAARQVGALRSNIKNCCRGKRSIHTVAGYIWKYINT